MTEFGGFDSMNEAQLQQFFSYFFAQGSTIGQAKTGVLSGLTVTQTTTASGSVLVDAGMGVAQNSRLTGVKPLLNDTQKTLDVLGATPMGSLPRNDVVVFDASTESIRLIPGTPNATPSDPALPTLCVALARLRHSANDTAIPTSHIDDLRVPTSLLGGTQVVANSAQRDALPKYVGLKVYRVSALREETWDGTGWWCMAYGEESATVNGSGDFSINTGLSVIKTSTVENANGGSATGTRQNITVAKNAAYSGGNLTARVYAADDKSTLPNGTAVAIKWNAWGYA